MAHCEVLTSGEYTGGEVDVQNHKEPQIILKCINSKLLFFYLAFAHNFEHLSDLELLVVSGNLG
jgi:hypothetical protein